ncbi:hypothetical protein [Thiomonas intermedia]|uniref:hypothetical protein n=1 Tax=Thiomonas intermedia TaxID=926 RepID=UPI0009A47EAE|nr:hypothetical protein [Thiomonas intermedia]
MRTLILSPVRGRDLEADLRQAFDDTAVTSIFVPLGQKLFEAERQWRIDADMETGAGTWAIDGYDIKLLELTGADKRLALRMMGARR